MKKNMGSLDRVIRLIIAVILAVVYFTGTVTGIAGIILLFAAAILVLTSTVSFCPLYLPFSISTLREKALKK
jgi:hypothetical protein